MWGKKKAKKDKGPSIQFFFCVFFSIILFKILVLVQLEVGVICSDQTCFIRCMNMKWALAKKLLIVHVVIIHWLFTVLKYRNRGKAEVCHAEQLYEMEKIWTQNASVFKVLRKLIIFLGQQWNEFQASQCNKF